MRNYFFSLIAFIFFAQSSHAQYVEDIRIGLKLGLNMANAMGDDIDGDFLFAYHVGGFAEIPINEKLIFVPEILFSAQGFINTSSASVEVPGVEVSASAEQTVELNYFTFPLLLRFTINESIYFEGGPQIGLLSTAKSKFSGGSASVDIGGEFGDLFDGIEIEIDEPGNLNVRDQFSNIDYGASFGFGANFSDHIGMSVRYYLGLADITNAAIPGNIRNNVIMASFIYRF